jgi:predicted HTH domain antitoxin
MMSELIVTFPDDSVASLHVAPEQAADELKMLAAVKAYELGRMSSGAAARLAGVPRTVFLQKLGEYGVGTFRLTGEEIDRETPLV